MPNLTRRELLAGVAGLITTTLLPEGKAWAQTPTRPTTFRPISPEESIIANAIPGVTTNKEIANSPNLGKEDIGNGTTRYISPSQPLRPNIIIAENNGKVLFTRRMVPLVTDGVSIFEFSYLFGKPEALTPAPFSFYEGKQSLSFETQIWASQGFAAVTNKNNEVTEVHNFIPGTSAQEYIKRWVEGDFDPDAPKHPLGLVLIDGFLSNPQNKTFERFEKDLFPYYQKVAKFSYAGNDRADYGETDTFQSIYKSAEILKELIDKLKAYHPLDILAYSLGGAVLNAYLANHVLPINGAHREGVVRKVVTLHSPIHGISLTATVNIDSLEELNAMAINPEITAPLNRSLAKALRDLRGIGILNLGNESDCIVPPGYTVNLGFGMNKDLGRGKNGIKNCTDMINSVFPDLNIADNAGHTGLLSDYGTIKTVERFLKSAQLTAFLGE